MEDENSRFKRLVAGLGLDKEMLKAVIAKKTALARRPEDGYQLAARAVRSRRTRGVRAYVTGK
jgi:hypothetical protein